MRSLNKLILLGRLGQNPEPKKSKGGHNYTQLQLATHRRKKQKNGEWIELTDWHSVQVWGSQSEFCVEFLKKGCLVLIEGQVQAYEKQADNGVREFKTLLTADQVSLVAKSTKYLIESTNKDISPKELK